MEPDKPGLTAEVELHKNPPSAHRHFQAGEDAEQYIHSIILFLVYFIIVVSKDQFILQFLGSKHLSFVIFQCLLFESDGC